MYEGQQYRIPTANPLRRGRFSDIDIDSITCALDLSKFADFVNVTELATLHSKHGSDKALAKYTLFATICGYNIYVEGNAIMKERVCTFIRRRRPYMHPSESPMTFFYLYDTLQCCCGTKGSGIR